MKPASTSLVRSGVLVATALSLWLAACGGDDASDDGSGGNGGAGTGTPTAQGGGSGGEAAAGGQGAGGSSSGGASSACATLHEGTNEGFMVDGEPREFVLNLPSNVDAGGPWPVIFNWHGLGDTAQNMSGLVSGMVDNAVMPFIAVTPEDTNVVVMGMQADWAVFQVTADNKEARLFDEVLACLDQLYGVNTSHVHSLGFSLGGIVTDMLGTIRGDQLASIATYSGGYWSNPENLDPTISAVVSWPEYTTTNQYAQMFVHGGTDDAYSLVIYTIHFDQYAVNDTAFLNGRGHDAILCDHGSGHTVPSSIYADKLVEFFADHPLGTVDSPYANDGLPPNFPGYCEFQAGL